MADVNVVPGFVDIIDRRGGALLQRVSQDASNIDLTRSSTIRISGSPDSIARYERQGNDLILHGKDGSVARYKSFFLVDAEGFHSELVFDDGSQLIHANFPAKVAGVDAAALAAGEAITLVPGYESLSNAIPLLLDSGTLGGLSNAALGGILGAIAVGGGIIAAASSGGGDHDSATPSPEDPGSGGESTLTVNPLADDNALNRSEIGQSQVLSGSTTGVAAGQTITITFNGQTYTTTVDQDGNWSLTLPPSVFAGLEDGTYPLVVSVIDTEGDTYQQDVSLLIDTLPPFLTANKVTGDDMLTAQEITQAQTLSGRGEAGLTVTVTLNGETYTTTVDENGNWQLTLPAAALAALTEGAHTLTVTTVDGVGNSTTVTRTLVVDTEAPPLTVNPLTGDDLLTADELGNTQTLSGTTATTEAGQTVTVTFNGNTYTGIVNADGTWQITLPAADLQGLTNGSYPLVASITDKAGNSTTLPARTITVDSNAEAINISTVSSDDRLNATEAAQALTLSGTSAHVASGTTVTVTFNGHTYTTTILSDGTWSLSVPSTDLVFTNDGNYSITASTTGISGDGISTTHTLGVYVNTLPAATLETPFGDGVLNSNEAGQDQTLQGTTGITGAGQTVTVSLGGKAYTATVDSDGHWQVTIPSVDLQSLVSGTNPLITVDVSDAAGNTATVSQSVSVDKTPPTLSLSVIAQDDLLNGTEMAVNQTVTGTASISEAGRTVTLTLNGKTYTATVDSNGNWQTSLPAADLSALSDGSHLLTVSLSDAAGNTTTLTRTLTVDSGILSTPTLTISDFTGDNVITGAEAKVSQLISGTTTHVEAGRTVTLTLNGKTYFATVESGGSWHVTVPSTDMALLPSGASTITASVTNHAGYTASDSQGITLDASGNAIAISIISSDNLLNQAEAALPLAISGNTANIPAGQTVTVTLNSKTYTTTVQADGTWTLQIPSTDLQALSDGDTSITATVSDLQGSSVSDAQTLGVHIHTLPTPTIDTPFGNGSLNLSEAGVDQVISGKTGISGSGQSVAVSIGGNTYAATVDNVGNWSVTLPAADLSQLSEGSNTITATVKDVAGNQATSTFTSLTDFTAPHLTIGTVAGDDVINLAEAQGSQTVNGTASISEAGRTVVVSLGGQYYTGTVGTDGNWSVTLPADALTTLNNGSYSLVASLTDASGNTTQSSKTVTLRADPDSQPTVTVNAFVSESGTISASDTKVSQVLSGTTTNVEEGQTVTITLHTKVYYTTVNSSGDWWVAISASDMAQLPEGTVTISADVVDTAGNWGTSDTTSTLDLANDSISISIVAVDNQLNRVEASQPLTVSGATANVATGQTVTVTLNGKTYTGTTAADGSWSVSIPSADLLLLQDGTTTLSASVANPNDDPVTTQTTLGVHINTLPQPSLETAFADGILNAAEAASSQSLMGKTGITGSGQQVNITLNGKTYLATVDSAGNWNLALSATDLQALTSGQYTLSVTATDVAGNSATLSSTITVDTIAPTLTLKPLTSDGIINHQESLLDQTLSGNASLSEVGRVVLVTLNGKQYTAMVQADGSWSTTVPSADLQGMADGNYSISATLVDAAGNSTTTTGQFTLDANTANLPVLTVNAIAVNNIIDGAEIKVAQTLSGGSMNLEAGQTVTVTLAGIHYTTTVDNQGNWQVIVPVTDLAQLPQGSQTIDITAQDKSGNLTTTTQAFSVNTALSGISVNTIAGDDKLNQSEIAQTLTVTGGSQNVATGTTVTVLLHGKTYSGVTAADGSWSITVPTADLQQLTDGNTTLTVSTTDSAGNALSSSHTFTVYINQLPVVTLNTVFGDGTLNATEASSAQTLSGATGLSSAGQTVSVTLGGITYNATVDATGHWSITLPASVLQALPDGSATLQVVASDSAGNQSTLTQTFSVDRTPPTLTLGTLTSDNILNQTEVLSTQTLSGSASLSEAGRTVSVTLNGKAYTTTVANDGSWSVTFNASDLSALADGTYTLSATLSDTAGNTTTTTSTLTVDASAQHAPKLTLNLVASNNIIDGAEIQTSQILSGTTVNVEAGRIVTLVFNGKTYSATVQSDGSWSTPLPSSDMALLTNGQQTLSASVSDLSGNSVSASQSIIINTNASGLSLAAITGDNLLNAQEAAASGGITVSGTSSNVAVGASVTVLLNGKTYSGLVQSDGSWSTNIPSADLLALGDGPVNVSASVTDQVGTVLSSSQSLNVSINHLPVAAVDTPFGDGYLNLAEAQAGQTLTGTTGITGAGQTVTVTIGNQTFTGSVSTNGHWQVALPASALTLLSDANTAIAVTVSDAAGNSSTVATSAIVDLTPPVLGIDAVSIDDVINIAESLQPIVISGTSPVNDSGQTVVVSVTINGQIYQGIALSDGTWYVTVPAGDLAGSTNGTTTIVATMTDAAGNQGSTTRTVTLDTDPTQAPTVTIATLAGDDYLNADEATQSLTLSGTTTHVQQGQQVTLTLNNQTYSATVGADGSWTTTVSATDVGNLPDGKLTVTANVSDNAGNPASSTHTLTVIAHAADLPTITISTVSDDDVVNAQDAQSPMTLSGTTTNVTPGRTVTVTLNNKTYLATVASDGSWTTQVPASDVQALPQGQQTITASVSDVAQNPASTTHNIDVDTTPPLLEINALVSTDDIGLAAALAGLPLTGSCEEGLHVTIKVGSATYTTIANSSGVWQVTLSASDLLALGDGSATITASATDSAGNSSDDALTIVLKTQALPTLTLNDVYTDNMLSKAELAASATIGGTYTELPDGTTLQITIGSYTTTTTTVAGGIWSATIAANALAGLSDGSVQISVTAVDNAGNPASTSGTLEVVTHNTFNLTLTTPFIDGALNATEAAVDQILTGSTGVIGSGQVVTVTLDGHDYAATVTLSGQWSVTIPSADLLALGDGTHTLTVTAEDKAGNSTTPVQISVNSIVDDVPVASVTQPLFGDGFLSLSDVTDSNGLSLSGQTGLTSNSGQSVSVSVNGVSYNASVNNDGSWSLPLSSTLLQTFPDGTITVNVTITDSVGNTSTTSATAEALFHSLPSATLNLPFGDGYLNIDESDTTQIITGSTGISGSSQTVTITLDKGLSTEVTYSDTDIVVDGLGGWSLSLTPTQLDAFTNGTHTLQVTVTDRAGNSSTSSVTTVTAALTLPSITIDDLPFGANDGTNNPVLNITEASSAITLTGSIADNGIAQTVKVEIDLNGVVYQATVNGDTWSLTLPANALSSLSDSTSHTVTVTATDAAGNSNDTEMEFTSDLTAPVITLATPFGDGYLNAAEIATLTGTVDDNAATISVTIGSTSYPASVTNGTWTLTLTSGQLALIEDGTYAVKVTATDTAGNSSSTSGEVTIVLDLPTITIDTFVTNNELNYAESLVVQTLSGTSERLDVGQVVTITLNSKTYTTQIGADGTWHVLVSASDLQAVFNAADLSPTIVVTASDKAGNTITGELEITIDPSDPGDSSLVIDPVTVDNIINLQESQTEITISGVLVHGNNPQSVEVTFNGNTQTVDTLLDGTWSATFDAIYSGTLTDTTLTITATTEVGGVTVNGSATVAIDITPPAAVTIDSFSGDQWLNHTELSSAQTITGSAAVSDAGLIVSVKLNNKTYSAVVQSDGSWSTSVPSADLALLAQGEHDITATITDSAGNESAASTLEITVDTVIPTLTVNVFAGNNILTLAETTLGQVLSGTGEAGASVTLTLGTLTASATVNNQGVWQISLTQNQLLSLTDGAQVASLVITDSAGNSNSTSLTVNVALNQSLGVVVDSLFGNDGVLNYAESLTAQVISGHTTGQSVGATVSVAVMVGTVTLTTLTATVGASGLWSVSVPASILSGLANGDVTLNVGIVDVNGNSQSTSVDIDVLRTLPTLDTLVAFTDGKLNATETTAAQLISGVVSNYATSATVTVTLGNKTYSTSVGTGGAWSVSIPAADLLLLQDGTLSLGVTVVDAVGNATSQTLSIPAIIHHLPSITLNPIFGDGLLNIADLSVAQTLSGTATNLVAGSTISINLAGVQTLTATVAADGTWSTSVSTAVLALLQNLGSTSVTVTASATDNVGNTTASSGTLTVGLSFPVVTLNAVFGGDGYLSAAEALVAQTISGVATNAAAGSLVTVTLGSKTFTSTVGAAGAFSVTLQPADLAALADGSLTLNVAVTNSSGNTGTSVSSITAIAKNLPTISLNTVFGGDGYLNVSEAASGQIISGTTTNAAVGATISVTLGTLTLNTTVQTGGTWSITATAAQLQSLLSGNLTVSATVTDAAGNSSATSTGITVATAQPTLTFNTLFGNGILDLNDLLTTQTLSGTTTNVAAGTPLTITLGSKTYTTTISSGGSWSLTLPTADLQALSDGSLTINATLTDVAGNTINPSTTVTVAINALPTITLNALFGGDGLLNAVEAASTQVISGTTTNAVGSTVKVTLGGKTWSTVVQSNGTWSVSLTAAELSALSDGSLTLGVALTNSAGKNVSTSSTVGVGIHSLPTIAIGTLFGDGYLNLTEAQANQVISGTSTNAVGSSVTVTVGSLSLTTTVTSNGTWSVTVPTANLVAVADGNLSIGVTVKDSYGNTNSASSTAIVKTHALPQLGIDATTLTGALGILTNGLVINGDSNNLQTGAKVTVTLQKTGSVLNGVTFSGTVLADGSWSAKLEGSILSSLGLTVITLLGVLTGTLVAASATDIAGNGVSVSAGIATGIALPVSVTSLDVASLSIEDSSASLETSQVASLSSEDSDSSTDTTTLSLASVASTTTESTSTESTSPDDATTYSLDGVTLTLAESGLIIGSDGDDSITLTTLDFTQIDGGAGTDTLVLAGEHLSLDLTTLGLTIGNIEIFDLGDTGTNSITLDLERALAVTDKPEDDLRIQGAAGNEVNLIPDASGVWANSGQRDVDGLSFDVYHNSGLDSSNTLGDVLVQQGLLVNLA